MQRWASGRRMKGWPGGLLLLLLVLLVLLPFIFLLSDPEDRDFGSSAADVGAIHDQKETADEPGLPERERSDTITQVETELEEKQSKRWIPEFADATEPGWRLYGTVVEHGPRAPVLSQVKVLCYVVKKDGTMHLLSEPAITGSQGRFSFSIPTARFNELQPYQLEKNGRIRVLAKKPGFIPDEEATLDSSLEDGLVTAEIDLELEEAPLIYGTVLAGDGSPVQGADVYFMDQDGWWTNQVQTDPEGQYEIFLETWSTPPRQLRAGKVGIGFSLPAPLDKGSGGETRAPLLILQPYESIEGTVEYPDGRPAAGVCVEAWPVTKASEKPDALAWFKEVAYEALINPPAAVFSGAPFGWAWTGPDGRFRIGGLKEDDYFLHLKAWDDGPLVDREPMRLACATGDRDLRLVLEQQVVDLYLRDEKGRLLTGARIFCNRHENHEQSHFESGSVLGGMARIELKPGRFTLLSDSGDFRSASRDLLINEQDFVTRVDLVLRAANPGRVRVGLVNSGKRKLNWHPAGQLCLYGESGTLTLTMTADDWDARGDLLVEAPAGCYSVSFQPSRESPFPRADSYFKFDFGEVEVLTGRESRIDLQGVTGGRLELTLQGESPAYSFLSMSWKTKDGASRAGVARFLFEQGEPVDLSGSASLKPGVPYLLDPPIRGGDYQLRLEKLDHTFLEIPFSITPDRVTKLQIRMTQPH